VLSGVGLRVATLEAVDAEAVADGEQGGVHFGDLRSCWLSLKVLECVAAGSREILHDLVVPYLEKSQSEQGPDAEPGLSLF
jgi:hypothetical protein